MILLEQFLNNLVWNTFSGEFVSRQVWDGYDLQDFREYQPGDSIKKINWKLSAKYDQEYVWVYSVEKEAKVDVIIDNNLNAKFFSEIIEQIFFLLNQYKTKFGLIVNFYIFDKKWNFKEIYDIQDIHFNKTNKFKSFKSKNYKIIISDFLFWDEIVKIDLKKTYLWVLPMKNILKKSEIPTMNWYFSSFINTDFLVNYEKKLMDLWKKTILEELD